jgi:hypothetical protein
MFLGAVICLIGILVTAASYEVSGGDTYAVAWGAILVGFITFLKGLLGA